MLELVLVRLIVCVGVRTLTGLVIPKLTAEGCNDTWLVSVDPLPLPDKEAVNPDSEVRNPGSLLVIDNTPARAPFALGRNVTLTVQLCPVESVAGQLFVCA